MCAVEAAVVCVCACRAKARHCPWLAAVLLVAEQQAARLAGLPQPGAAAGAAAALPFLAFEVIVCHVI